jgi:hypothetical protein
MKKISESLLTASSKKGLEEEIESPFEFEKRSHPSIS